MIHGWGLTDQLDKRAPLLMLGVPLVVVRPFLLFPLCFLCRFHSPCSCLIFTCSAASPRVNLFLPLHITNHLPSPPCTNRPTHPCSITLLPSLLLLCSSLICDTNLLPLYRHATPTLLYYRTLSIYLHTYTTSACPSFTYISTMQFMN